MLISKDAISLDFSPLVGNDCYQRRWAIDAINFIMRILLIFFFP